MAGQFVHNMHIEELATRGVSFNLVHTVNGQSIPEPHPEFYLGMPNGVQCKFSLNPQLTAPRYLYGNFPQRQPLIAWDDQRVKAKADLIQAEYPDEANKVTRPKDWIDLYQYFDAMDLWFQGAWNLWSVIDLLGVRNMDRVAFSKAHLETLSHMDPKVLSSVVPWSDQQTATVDDWVYKWLTHEQNRQKVAAWNRKGDILHLLWYEDWLAIGDCSPQATVHLRKALEYWHGQCFPTSYRQLPSLPPASPTDSTSGFGKDLGSGTDNNLNQPTSKISEKKDPGKQVDKAPEGHSAQSAATSSPTRLSLPASLDHQHRPASAMSSTTAPKLEMAVLPINSLSTNASPNSYATRPLIIDGTVFRDESGGGWAHAKNLRQSSGSDASTAGKETKKHHAHSKSGPAPLIMVDTEVAVRGAGVEKSGPSRLPSRSQQDVTPATLLPDTSHTVPSMTNNAVSSEIDKTISAKTKNAASPEVKNTVSPETNNVAPPTTTKAVPPKLEKTLETEKAVSSKAKTTVSLNSTTTTPPKAKHTPSPKVQSDLSPKDRIMQAVGLLVGEGTQKNRPDASCKNPSAFQRSYNKDLSFVPCDCQRCLKASRSVYLKTRSGNDSYTRKNLIKFFQQWGPVEECSFKPAKLEGFSNVTVRFASEECALTAVEKANGLEVPVLKERVRVSIPFYSKYFGRRLTSNPAMPNSNLLHRQVSQRVSQEMNNSPSRLYNSPQGMHANTPSPPYHQDGSPQQPRHLWSGSGNGHAGYVGPAGPAGPFGSTGYSVYNGQQSASQYPVYHEPHPFHGTSLPPQPMDIRYQAPIPQHGQHSGYDRPSPPRPPPGLPRPSWSNSYAPQQNWGSSGPIPFNSNMCAQPPQHLMGNPPVPPVHFGPGPGMPFHAPSPSQYSQLPVHHTTTGQAPKAEPIVQTRQPIVIESPAPTTTVSDEASLRPVSRCRVNLPPSDNHQASTSPKDKNEHRVSPSASSAGGSSNEPVTPEKQLVAHGTRLFGVAPGGAYENGNGLWENTLPDGPEEAGVSRKSELPPTSHFMTTDVRLESGYTGTVRKRQLHPNQRRSQAPAIPSEWRSEATTWSCSLQDNSLHSSQVAPVQATSWQEALPQTQVQTNGQPPAKKSKNKKKKKAANKSGSRPSTPVGPPDNETGVRDKTADGNQSGRSTEEIKAPVEKRFRADAEGNSLKMERVRAPAVRNLFASTKPSSPLGPGTEADQPEASQTPIAAKGKATGKSAHGDPEKPDEKQSPKPVEAEKLGEKPVDNSNKKAVDKYSNKPSVTSTTKPTEKPIEKTVTTSTDKVIETPAKKPMENPTENPVDTSIDKPTKKTVAKSSDKAVEESLDKHVEGTPKPHQSQSGFPKGFVPFPRASSNSSQTAATQSKTKRASPSVTPEDNSPPLLAVKAARPLFEHRASNSATHSHRTDDSCYYSAKSSLSSSPESSPPHIAKASIPSLDPSPLGPHKTTPAPTSTGSGASSVTLSARPSPTLTVVPDTTTCVIPTIVLPPEDDRAPLAKEEDTVHVVTSGSSTSDKKNVAPEPQQSTISPEKKMAKSKKKAQAEKRKKERANVPGAVFV
ncbi:hypothetical protein QBC35DRAFT_459212 [Podospora australis]|uniref:RRM domain-containing protein n=1 Tax=Podospora australis TaxID=1536484 RepID=A0AAN6X703_9PEZI|nr:hypothetical protein QBC35DRAFT_459212 [Podospora australis]